MRLKNLLMIRMVSWCFKGQADDHTAQLCNMSVASTTVYSVNRTSWGNKYSLILPERSDHLLLQHSSSLDFVKVFLLLIHILLPPLSFMWDHLCLDYICCCLYCWLSSWFFLILRPHFYSCTGFITSLDEALFLWSNITCISVIKHHIYFCDLNLLYFCDLNHIYFCDLNLINFCDQTSQPVSRSITLQSILWFITELDFFADHNWYYTLLLIIDSEIVQLQDGQFVQLRECHFLEFLLLRV